MVDIFKGAPLYLVTDRRLCRDKGLIPAVEDAVGAGVRFVQLREKDLPARDLLVLAGELRSAASRHGAVFIVNDRLDVALLAGADGVHLGQAGFSPRDVRPYLAKGALIGVSTHSLKEAKKAEADGADYITFGPVRHTPSKAVYGAPVGFDELKKAADAVRIPVFAIGGMNKRTVKGALGAGAKGVAVVSAILAGGDVAGNVKEMMAELNSKEPI